MAVAKDQLSRYRRDEAVRSLGLRARVPARRGDERRDAVGVDGCQAVASGAGGTSHGEEVWPERGETQDGVPIEPTGESHEKPRTPGSRDPRCPGAVDRARAVLAPGIDEDSRTSGGDGLVQHL